MPPAVALSSSSDHPMTITTTSSNEDSTISFAGMETEESSSSAAQWKAENRAWKEDFERWKLQQKKKQHQGAKPGTAAAAATTKTATAAPASPVEISSIAAASSTHTAMSSVTASMRMPLPSSPTTKKRHQQQKKQRSAAPAIPRKIPGTPVKKKSNSGSNDIDKERQQQQQQNKTRTKFYADNAPAETTPSTSFAASASTATESTSGTAAAVAAASIAACPIPRRYVDVVQRAFGTETASDAAAVAVDLYADVLRVPPSANEHELRIAYFRRGRQVLASDDGGRAGNGSKEDKELSDQAKQRFQAVSMTYEIVSSPRMKLYYDQYGFQGCIDYYAEHDCDDEGDGNAAAAAATADDGKDSEQKSNANQSTQTMTPDDGARGNHQRTPSQAEQPGIAKEEEWDALSDPSSIQFSMPANANGRNSIDLSSQQQPRTKPFERALVPAAACSSGRSVSSRSIRWNEHVEELLYDQDPDEVRFKSRRQQQRQQRGHSQEEDDDDGDADVSETAFAIIMGQRQPTNRSEAQKPAKHHQNRMQRQEHQRKVKRQVVVEAQELGAHLDRLDEELTPDNRPSGLVDEFLNSMEASLDSLEASVDSFVRYAMSEEEQQLLHLQNQQRPDPPTDACLSEIAVDVLSREEGVEVPRTPTPDKPDVRTKNRVRTTGGNDVVGRDDGRADDDDDDPIASLFADLTKPAPRELEDDSSIGIASKAEAPVDSKKNNKAREWYSPTSVVTEEAEQEDDPDDLAVQLFATLTKPAPDLDDHSVNANYVPPSTTAGFSRGCHKDRRRSDRSGRKHQQQSMMATGPEPSSLWTKEERRSKADSQGQQLQGGSIEVEDGVQAGDQQRGRTKTDKTKQELVVNKVQLFGPDNKQTEDSCSGNVVQKTQNEGAPKKKVKKGWDFGDFDPFADLENEDGGTFEDIPFQDALPVTTKPDTQENGTALPDYVFNDGKPDHDCARTVSTISVSEATGLLAAAVGKLARETPSPIDEIHVRTPSSKRRSPVFELTDETDKKGAQGNGPELIALMDMDDSRDMVGILAQGINESFNALASNPAATTVAGDDGVSPLYHNDVSLNRTRSAISSLGSTLTFDMTAQHEHGLRGFCNDISKPSPEPETNGGDDDLVTPPCMRPCSRSNDAAGSENEDFVSRFVSFVKAIGDDFSKFGSNLTSMMGESVKVPEDDVQSFVDVLSKSTRGTATTMSFGLNTTTQTAHSY